MIIRLQIVLALWLVVTTVSFSQNSVGIGTPTPSKSAVLELVSPGNNQGFLVPRMTNAQRTASGFTSSLTAVQNGLLVFDTEDLKFYYWQFPAWKAIEAGGVTTTWRSGTGIPSNTLGIDGDFYLDVASSNIYQRKTGAYVLQLTTKGPKGDKGDTGSTGLQGPQGNTGLTGAAGAQGPTGATGAQGPTGAVGAQGPIGPTGATGSQGPTGVQGVKGDKGDTGSTGVQGPAGSTGAQGVKGDKGDTGNTGSQGPKGDKGDIGNTGSAGATGAQGPKGDTGNTGSAGATGAQGPKGDKGDTGATGAQGIQGLTGPQGPSNLRVRTTTVTTTMTASDDVLINISPSASIGVVLPKAASVDGQVYYIKLRDPQKANITLIPSSGETIEGDANINFNEARYSMMAIVSDGKDTWYIISAVLN